MKWSTFIVLLVCASMPITGFAQERRKITISNATLSYSALPLVAAREWKLFEEQALTVEVILMRSAAAAAALVSGDLDYQSGIGPASIGATLSGVDSRALWSSTNRITYWLMAKPEYKSIQELRRKKIGVSGTRRDQSRSPDLGAGEARYRAKRIRCRFRAWRAAGAIAGVRLHRCGGAQSTDDVFCPAARVMCRCSISVLWSKWPRAA